MQVSKKINIYKSIGKNITLKPSIISNGKQIVLIVENGNLSINGNQLYQKGGIKSIDDIPQVVLIVRNGNIIVNDDVDQIDAWLVANGLSENSGVLYTCNIPTNKINSKNCAKQLTINGPVMVDFLKLLRTANADHNLDSLNKPAELFNLRPDAYLWADSLVGGESFTSTVYIQEMSPRY